MRDALLRGLAAGAAALVGLSLPLAAAAPARAHDELVDVVPADGSTLRRAPDELVLTFSGEVSELGAAVAVTGAGEEDLVMGGPVVQGREVLVEVGDAPSGTYTVAYRVTSGDGHPITGSTTFTLDVPTAAPEPVASATATPTPGDASTEAAAPPGPQTQAVGAQPPAGLPVWASGALVAAAAAGLVGVVLLLRRRGAGRS